MTTSDDVRTMSQVSEELVQRLVVPKQKQRVQPAGLMALKWYDPSGHWSQRLPSTLV
jgi:hypothetical protein